MPDYVERLSPSPWIYLATSLLIPGGLITFYPISPLAAAITAVALFGGALIALRLTTARITVQDGVLRAGRASIPVSRIGGTAVFRGEQGFRERGQNLDTRAWLLLRGWIDPVLRIEVRDPEDPTPYWLVSTRRPEELAAAITAAQRSSAPSSA